MGSLAHIHKPLCGAGIAQTSDGSSPRPLPLLGSQTKARVKDPLGHAWDALMCQSSLPALPLLPPPPDLPPPLLSSLAHLWSFHFLSKFPVDMLVWVIENNVDISPGGRGGCGPAGKGPAPYTYQFQQRGARDLHRENAVGAAPDGGSTSLPRHLQIPPASSHTDQMEGSEGALLCWALEILLSALHSLSAHPTLERQAVRRLNSAYLLCDPHSFTRHLLAPILPNRLLNSVSQLLTYKMGNGNKYLPHKVAVRQQLESMGTCSRCSVSVSRYY